MGGAVAMSFGNKIFAGGQSHTSSRSCVEFGSSRLREKRRDQHWGRGRGLSREESESEYKYKTFYLKTMFEVGLSMLRFPPLQLLQSYSVNPPSPRRVSWALKSAWYVPCCRRSSVKLMVLGCIHWG